MVFTIGISELPNSPILVGVFQAGQHPLENP